MKSNERNLASVFFFIFARAFLNRLMTLKFNFQELQILQMRIFCVKKQRNWPCTVRSLNNIKST